jgi:RNA-directed DNA polymerase
MTLYEELCSFEHLYYAFMRARKGKRKQEEIAAFERNLEPELFKLREALLAQQYRPGGYHSFYLTEAKRRLISAAPFPDRVVHHALIGVTEPIFERHFIFDSYANRKGKGTHRALDRCTYYLRRNAYSLQCDIRQFFPSIDHTILKAMLGKLILDKKVRWLADQIIDTGVGVLDEEYEMHWFPGDDPSTGSGQGLFAANRPRGLPIGNLTSQFWANLYLNALDQFVKRELKCRSYIRYVDDFLLFADDKKTLHGWKEAIVEFLASLRLTIHEAAPVRPVSEGLPFLGFILYPNYRRLKPARGYEFRRNLHQKLNAYADGELDAKKLDASIQGWVAHATHGDTWGLRRTVFSGQKL